MSQAGDFSCSQQQRNEQKKTKGTKNARFLKSNRSDIELIELRGDKP